MYEDVRLSIGVPNHQVRGGRRKGHVAPVGANRGLIAVTVPLGAAGSEADAGGLMGLSVMYEDIPHALGVPGHQVGGRGREGYVTPIGADRGLIAVTIPLGAAGGQAYPFDLAGLSVMHEDIPRAVAVPGHQIRGGRREGHVPPVGAEGGEVAVEVPLRAAHAPGWSGRPAPLGTAPGPLETP